MRIKRINDIVRGFTANGDKETAVQVLHIWCARLDWQQNNRPELLVVLVYALAVKKRLIELPVGTEALHGLLDMAVGLN